MQIDAVSFLVGALAMLVYLVVAVTGWARFTRRRREPPPVRLVRDASGVLHHRRSW